jgi:peptide/nickel transport system ATP-binding protein
MAVLEAKDIVTRYKLKAGILTACDGVSLKVAQGEALGLVGESACGKSSLAASLVKLLPKNGRVSKGSVLLDGRDILRLSEEELKKVRWKEISLIFQGAMNALNPVHTVGDQVSEAIRIHESISVRGAWQRTEELFAQVEIDPKRMKQYPHEFSGGMRQRVMIAMGIACRPGFVIGDEPTTGLDVMVKSQILKLLERLRGETGMGMIMITHDLSCVVEICERVAVMYAGRIVEHGNTEIIFNRPAHPYTIALLGSFPDIEGERIIKEAIIGSPPNLLDPPSGCRFHPRCSFARPSCQEERPDLVEIEANHYCACPVLNR